MRGLLTHRNSFILGISELIEKISAIRRYHLRVWAGVVLFLALVFVGAAVSQIPIRSYASLIQQWIGSFGPWGIVLFSACYVLEAIFAPTTPLTVLAGFAFGLSVGLPLVMFSATLSATMTFLLARYFLRAWTTEAIAEKPWFKVLDRAVGSSGWRIILLSQLSPFIPFNVQNLFYGLSRIRLRVFVLGSVVGGLPGTAFCVYLGAVGRAVTHQTLAPMRWGLLLVGLFATAFLLFLISRAAHTRLSELITTDQG